MKPTIVVFASLLAFLLAAGCSSTSSGTLVSQQIIRGTPVRVIGAVNDQEQLFMPDLVKALETRGFAVLKEGKSQYTAQLSFDSSSAFNVRCTITLMKDGVPIVSGGATNPGWGTLIARGKTSRHVFDSALQEFDRKLYGP
jgi:hypothetical protein